MKNLLLILACLLAAAPLAAQTDRTQKVQSAHLNLLGLHYNYTIPVGKRWTLTPHAGLSGELGWSSTNFWSWEEDGSRDGDWFYTLRGNVGLDVRYYYNLTRRLEQGRVTACNSGNFFAVDFQYMTPAFLKHNMGGEYLVVAYPCWGIRRVYQAKYLIEVTAGALTGVQGDEWGIKGPKFDLKIGFVF